MKIVIVDQFPVLRSGLVSFLKQSFSGLSVIEKGHLDGLFDVAQPECIDMVIVGLSYHCPANLSRILKKIKHVYAKAKIVVYDDKPEPDAVIAFMQGGVDGYLSKATPVEDLRVYVEDILEGNSCISKDIISSIVSCNYLPSQETRISGKRSLTAHEYEIARYLSEGMRTNRIADILDRKASTISTIKSTIFRKLEVDNVVKLRDLIGVGEVHEISRI